ncbi:hypothetical protein AB98_4679 [Escherichia coli 1-176-05_S3_C1]|nr:hypothetical protein AB98_4679 [Escherichia coli 1-176-05_S3_C1]
MVVALLLCTSAVTPIPAQKASGFFFDAPAKDSTQTRAEDAHYAGSNNMSPPDQQGDGRKQVKQR